MKAAAQTEFVDFVDATSPGLLHLGWLLCGDPHQSEELVQETYERVFRRWGRLDQPLAYARRVLVNLNTERWRRTHKELLSIDGTMPELVGADEEQTADNRRLLVSLLQALPPRERQIVVLRHYADLPEREVADLLGVSVGTVKSSASRGLAAMRTALTSTSEATR